MKNDLAYYKSVVNEKQVSKNDLLFSTLKFNLLNQDKADELFYVVASKASLILGMRGQGLLAPFSAPFIMPRYASPRVKCQDFIDLFEAAKSELSYEYIKVTLPPYIYNENVISKISAALSHTGFELSYRDLNSHIDLLSHQVIELPSKVKKIIKIADKKNFHTTICKTYEEKLEAYNIIKKNREEKNYPLRMTWDQVWTTTESIANSTFFITKLDNVACAAAIVFEISDDAAQVVYWGGIKIGEANQVMYSLPFEVINYYKELGFKMLDIGPSSEFGEISLGLNDYKQNIGCLNSFKETWEYRND